MPKGIPYIISNEFAERFCFYGINSILTIYMVQFLRFTDADGATWQSLFKSGAYFFPMLGAIISDVFWGKFRTIMVFSTAYVVGCTFLAFSSGTAAGLALGLLLIALGTGGIKPCVSTNVGDQFTSKNQHLIERAFSWFYLAINAGSSISIALCPWLLNDPKYGPRWAFGMPAVMMAVATLVFWLGRKKFAVVPPAGKAWLKDVFSTAGLKLMLNLLLIYFFVACFWMLWDQSNGNTWTLQAQSSLMDKNLGLGFDLSPLVLGIASALLILGLERLLRGFLAPMISPRLPAWSRIALSLLVLAALLGKPVYTLLGRILGPDFTVLPAQIQVVNGIFILALVPVFSYGIYPVLGRFFAVTPLRKIGIGLFTVASSFLIVAWVEQRIQEGHVVSAWWQILAYVVITAAEVLVSITALEFSYKQAPLRMKSFIMALFLLSISLGNLMIAGVNKAMVKPLQASTIEAGEETWVRLPDAAQFVSGQKIDFTGENGIRVLGGKEPQPLEGTFLVAQVDSTQSRVRLMDVINRQPVRSEGAFSGGGDVATYRLVGPQYFYFFSAVMAGVAVIFIFVAMAYKEQTHVRAA
jgi:proton-dependent oligopeptide transporter, POT family